MRSIIAATIIALGLTGTASAGTIKLKLMLDKTLLTPVTISNDGGSTYVKTRAGQLGVTRIGGDDPIDVPADVFFTYCLETRQQLASGTFLVEPLEQGNDSAGGLGPVRADHIRELFGRFQPSLYDSVSNIMGAAIQLAIWEIANENSASKNLLTGNFRVTAPAATIALAQSYLNAINGSGPRLNNLFAAVNRGYQDLLLQDGDSQIVVAEPAAIAVLGLGFAGLIAARRRARR